MTGIRPALALLAALSVVTLVSCDGDDEQRLTASPLPEPTTASPTGSPTPTPTPTPSPTSSPTPSPTPTGPTDADRGRFVAGYQPEDASDLEHVAVDLDGDDIEELVFAYVRTGDQVSHVDVARWRRAEGGYTVTFRADAGPARRVDRLRIADVNADGLREIVTFQSTDGGSSLTLWQAVGGQVQPLPAVGGCHDGSNTYGVVGAEMEDRDGDGDEEIIASCDDSPLPVAAWSEDVYTWEQGAYRVQEEGPVRDDSPTEGGTSAAEA